ncbi:MAG: hypothetical protein KTR31_30055 [Myxococcales bacterium]|nr:hypothetical protein [Myxococcales bacterium]
MLSALAVVTALAGSPTPVPLVVPSPPEVPLFLKAEVVSVKAKVKTDDCSAAAAAALAMAQERGVVVGLVIAPDDLRAQVEVSCQQRPFRRPRTSKVALHALVIAPGAPPTVYPSLPAERLAEIARLLGSLEADPATVPPIDDIAGKAWIRYGRAELPEVLDSEQLDRAARARRALGAVAPDWVARWVPIAQQIPEVHGAILEVEVHSQEGQDKGPEQRELFRFSVPRLTAEQFVAGQLDQESFLASGRLEVADNPRSRNFEALTLP